jgi:hypothetical protein
MRRASMDLHPAAGAPAAPRRQRGGPVAARVLSLQRTAGNRAVGHVLARQTGLRGGEAIKRYARKAVAFWRRNHDLPLKYFAIYLGAAVNEELAAVGCKTVDVKVSEGSLGAAAEFVASDWQMLLNPKAFTDRPEAQTLGDLEPEEAATIAMTVYHEARHAEQHFRIARLQAGEHRELGFDMESHAAEEAAKAPLTARTGSARELSEARDWRSDEIGDDATYREAVTWWVTEIGKAVRLAHDVDAEHAAEVRERVGRLLHGWGKPGGAEDTIRSHLGSARKRRASLIIKDITRMTVAFDRAEAAWKQLGEDAKPSDFKPLTEALIELDKAIYAAYGDQPVEGDAWGAGNAIFAAFTALAAPPRKAGAVSS